MWTVPYALVRAGRGLVAITAVRTVVGDYSPIPLAMTETVSAASDIAGMLPYFGSPLWMALLLPLWSDVYRDNYLWSMRHAHRREFRALVATYTLLLLVIALRM